MNMKPCFMGVMLASEGGSRRCYLPITAFCFDKCGGPYLSVGSPVAGENDSVDHSNFLSHTHTHHQYAFDRVWNSFN